MTDRVYLDHAATSPMLPQVREAWLDQSAKLGNPSSLHATGRATRQAIEEARESIAADLGARPSEVIFTSGGTEADNLAIKGLFWQRNLPRLMCSEIEHHAVLDPVEWLVEHQSAVVDWIDVDALGRVDIDHIKATLDVAADQIALCTVMWANNEVGTVQPVHAIASLCREYGVPFHTDAVQAIGSLDVSMNEIDALSLSGHKIGGPFGVGALILNRNLAATPILHGGGQERDIRSGTLDAPDIVALSVAVRHAVEHRERHARELAQLRDHAISSIKAAVPTAIMNGDPEDRLPGNVHFSFPDCEGDALLMLLDAAGIDCSTGSACTAGIPEASHVLLAMGVDEPLARGSLRFSLGRTNTAADIDRLVAALSQAVERATRSRS